MTKTWFGVDPVIFILFIGLFLSMCVLLAVNHFWPNDGEMFTAIEGIMANFSGAFFMRMVPKHVDTPSQIPQLPQLPATEGKA